MYFFSMFARVVLGGGGFIGHIKGRGVVIVSVIMGHSFIFYFFFSVCCVWLCVHLSLSTCLLYSVLLWSVSH